MKALIQEHQKIFWGQNQTFTPYSFHLQATKHHAPKAFVIASVMGDCLQLSYFIQKHPKLNMADAHSELIQKADYLWEQDCFECFVELNHQLGYFEMNLSPKGAYNIYQFQNHRYPSVMPPVEASEDEVMLMVLPQTSINQDSNFIIRHVALKFFGCPTVTKIHPCVILYHQKEAIYYAKEHANPADFHQKQFWQVIA